MIMINYLYDINRCDIDFTQFPIENNWFLGISSLWSLIILLHSNMFVSKYIFTLNVLLFTVTVVSVMFWYEPVYKSVLHYNNKYMATLLGINILIYTLIKRERRIVKLILIAIKLLFFHLSNSKEYVIQFIFHMLFRYIYFWILYLTFIRKKIKVLHYSIITISYILNYLSYVYIVDQFSLKYVNILILEALYIFTTNRILNNIK